MPSVRHLLFLIALTSPASSAPLEVPGVARLELPATFHEESAVSLRASPTGGITPRAGERVLAAVRITGRAALAHERAELAEARLTFATRARTPLQSVVVKTRALALPIAGYEPRAQVHGGEVTTPVPLPTWISGPVEVYLIDHSQSVEQVAAADLVPDPLDPAPLGGRRPLILIHGKDNHDLTEGHHHAAKLQPFEGLRRSADYPGLLRLYKPYFYVYPSYRSTDENGRELVRLVREKLGVIGTDRVGVLAHSMGGVVLRRAMAHGLAGPLAVGITTSSPHHGALASSLIFANDRISKRIGALAALLLRYGKGGEPDTPGLRSVAWDNYDGGITADEERRYGVLVNRELAAFNRTFAHADKLVTMMGDVSSLLGHGHALGVKDEAYRRVQGAWAPKYANADPMVCHWSGIFDGAAVRERVVFDGFDHEQIIGSKRAVATIMRLLKGEAVAAP